MAKPKGINNKAKYISHFSRLNAYAVKVQKVYDTLNDEIARMVLRSGYNGEAPFRFSDFPETRKAFEEVQSTFVSNIRSIVYTGTSEEWRESNLVQDLLVDKTLKFYGSKAHGEKHKVYYQTNSDALKAFQQRKDKGMSLSQKLWNQSKDYKTEMEYAISSAIEKGTSAVTLSKRLSKYLLDFPRLQKDYKEKYGKAVNAADCEYRSIRLARSEINMAYRTAERERWQQLDFILGFKVKLTQNGRHKPDICDQLAGDYPKDFEFLGWHPNCMCYTVPILQSEKEFWGEAEPNPITDTPQGFKDYLMANKDRIEAAEERGTLPYWYKDNEKYVDSAFSRAFDLLALPDGIPSDYRNTLDRMMDSLDSRIENATTDYEKSRYRRLQVNVKKFGEMLADNDARAYLEEYLSFDDLYDNFIYSLEKKREADFSFHMLNYDRVHGFTRPDSHYVGRIPSLPKDSLLPNDMKKISEYLNSIDSLEEFYVKTGFKSYEDFFDSLGGINKVERRLKELADESSVYMCLNGSTLERRIIKGDGKFKNSLETGGGTFKVIGEERAAKERIMFGLSDDSDYDIMPKYGFLAGKDTMDYENIVGFGYGDAFVRFKDSSIRKRTTVSCGDSYDGNSLVKGKKAFFKSTPIASLDEPDANFSLGLLSHGADGANALKQLNNATKLSDLRTGTYIEAQIYGVLKIEDVDAIIISSKKQFDSLQKLLSKRGLDIKLIPCKYDTRLKLLEDGFTNYSGLASKMAHSLTNEDIDLLGDFYINGLCKRFADPKNGFWKKISMPDDFMDSMTKIANGEASSAEKRRWLKSYYEELRKKGEGKFPKAWWEDYSERYGGWCSDVIDESLLNGPQ